MEGKEFWTEVKTSSVSSGTLGVNIYEMGPGRSLSFCVMEVSEGRDAIFRGKNQ